MIPCIKNLCLIETNRLICIADKLTGFYWTQLFQARNFNRLHTSLVEHQRYCGHLTEIMKTNLQNVY